VVSLTVDSSNVVWVGTYGGGIGQFDGENWTVIKSSDGNIPDNSIGALATNAKGDVWIGTSSGLTSYNGEWKTYTTDDGMLSNSIFSIAFDKDGNVWVAGDGGISKLEGSDFSTYTKEDGLISNSVYFIAVDKNNNTWVATDAGVSKISDGEFTNYTTADGLISNMVNNIYVDKAGNVWFGTNAGVSMFDGTNWKSYTKEDGLGGDNAYFITSDKLGKIWIAFTDGGVTEFYNDEFIAYNVEIDDLASDEVYVVAVDKNNVKWIGTAAGVNRFEDVFLDVNSSLVRTDIVAYPNPATNYLIVKTNLAKYDNVSLSVYDMQGRTIMKQVVSQDQQQIDVKTINNGNYIYVLNQNGLSISRGLLSVKR
jgi:ligand-binding sensor domain-containing protein